MKMLKKYTVVLVSMVIAVVVMSSAAQASGNVHVNLVPAVIFPSVIVPVRDYHQANSLHNNKKNHHVNKRNNYYSKNVYKTIYRANSNVRVKRGFTSKIVNSGRSFHLNSKKVIRKLR